MLAGPKPSSTTVPPTSSSTGAAAPAAVKAVALGGSGLDEKGKPVCKFWGTTGGCRRGESCTYSHSWDGINKDGRCYGNGPDTNLKWHWVKMRITLGEPQLGPHHVQRQWTVVTHDCPTHPFESPTNSGLVYPTYPSVAASDTKRGK